MPSNLRSKIHSGPVNRSCVRVAAIGTSHSGKAGVTKRLLWTTDQRGTMNLLRILQGTTQPEVDLKRTYDAIVIGSGAAGGMAAHVLTSQGMKVLMLEAGQEARHRQRAEVHGVACTSTRDGATCRLGIMRCRSTNTRSGSRPTPPTRRTTKVYSYVQGWNGTDYSKNIVVDEKEHPYTGTNYAWVRARCLGGKTNIWGRLALRLSDYDFKAKSRDGYGEDWPISYKDIEPYYDRVDRYLGISGVKENLPAPARQHLSAADQADQRRADAASVAAEDESRADAVSRRRDDGRPEAQQVSKPVFRPRRLQSPRWRLRHSRRLRFSDRADLSRDGHGQPDPPHERRSLARFSSTRRPARRAACRSSMRRPAGTTRRWRRSSSSRHRHWSRRGCCCCRSLRRTRTASAIRAITSATTSASTSWVRASRDWSRTASASRGRSTTAARAAFMCRASGTSRTSSRTSSARYGFEGSAGTQMFPGNAGDTPGFGAAYKKAVRDYAGAFISMGGFGEVLARYENQVDLDPVRKDKWGIPVVRFNYRFGDNEKKMCEDMAARRRRCSSRPASRSSTSIARC